MAKELILGIDLGSSSVRGALFDGRGRILKRTFVKEERRLSATRDGGAELDANTALRQVIGVIDGVLERAPAGEITHIAACTFWHSLMGVDANGKPTTPVLGWADNRSRDSVAKLRRSLDEAAVQQRTGAHFHSSFWPAKLLWLRKNEPDIWERTARWVSFGDYVALKLFGQIMTSVSIASGTGVFNIRRCVWDTELLEYLKLDPRQLPEIAPTDDFETTLVEKWRKRWPRLASANWVLPIADGVANSVGSGCIDETRAALMIGTSGAMRVICKGDPPRKIPSGLWCYRVDRERVIIGGAISDGGGLYDWLKRNLRIDAPDAAVGREISKRGPDAHGLTFMPFLAGERSTGYDEFRTGEIHLG
ncbi:gluconokinase [Leptolyngbya sp. 7M]|uniref:gluconokinase n=1 Tax=Leptolyngbya sp. 7M TaxID=2812896 RepID=UPI001B8AFA04|nr:gluconokinase [Leptolyngbya sp. 7M]QYO64712.1 gluconokinase [Leptolyngbya sp. 7M]